MLILIVVLSGSLFLLVRVLIHFVEKAGGETIQNFHESADYISNTGIAPPQWSIKFVERIGRLQEKISDEELRNKKIETVKRKSKRTLRHRLKQVIKFYRASSTVADETTRERVVKRLKEARLAWKTKSWDEITGSESGTGFGPYY